MPGTLAPRATEATPDQRATPATRARKASAAKPARPVALAHLPPATDIEVQTFVGRYEAGVFRGNALAEVGFSVVVV
jgi:hypothetical protein